MMSSDFEDLPFKQGTVWLIGAGLEDPRLLIVRALNDPRPADVIVHGALAVDLRRALLASLISP